MKQRRSLRPFLQHTGGATAVEFALVAVPFFMMLMGIIEFGMFMLTKVALESIVAQAGREASVTTGTPGCDRVCTVRKYIETKASGLINANGVAITARNLTTGDPGNTVGELCYSNPPHFCDAAPCPGGTSFADDNHNGVCDGGTGTFSVGGPGHLIELRVVYPWQVLNPIMRPFFGPDGFAVITSATVVKNESS